jgi:hypothetical protein
MQSNMSQTFKTRLFRAELIRLLRLPGLYIAIGLAEFISLLAEAQAANRLPQLDLQLTFGAISVLQIALLVWSAQYGASHYESKSITRFVFIAGGNNQSLVIRLAALGLAYCLAILSTFALSLVGTSILALIHHKNIEFGGLLWLEDLRVLIAIAWFALIGFFSGLLTQSRALASAGTLALALVPSVVFVLTLQNLAGWMPLEIADRFIAGPVSDSSVGVTFSDAVWVMTLSLAAFALTGWLRAIRRRTKQA